MKKAPSSHPDSGMPPGLRRFVYLTAALTGAAIMIIEILGAKMLTPYVGMSHFVWTAQIAVTLVALACGYYAGGRIADRSPRLPILYWSILGAAVYLAFTVLACRPVSYWCLDFNLAVGSLLASGILFFVPLALLAMTGPFLVRMITSSVTGVGGNVGRLTSISTLGSFAGTLLIGYLIVPLLPNSWTMYGTALMLALICLLYFALFRRQFLIPAGLAALGAASSGLGVPQAISPHYSWMVQSFSGNSHFGMLQVLDRREAAMRYYVNDNLIQNTYDPEAGQSASTFTYMLSGLARAYTSNLNDVLCIGMGVGIVPMDFARQGARVDIVEINPAVVPVAVKHFGFEPAKVNLTIDDARHFLNRCRKQYDAVILDAFLGDSSPSHLMTREAFAAIRKVLRPGGTLSINCFAELEPGRDFFAASLNKTLQSVFPGVRLHYCGDGALFIAATDRPAPSFVHPPDVTQVHPRARHDVERALTGLVQTAPESGRVLTDDYNPVEYFDAKNRELVRRRLALGAKEM